MFEEYNIHTCSVVITKLIHRLYSAEGTVIFASSITHLGRPEASLIQHHAVMSVNVIAWRSHVTVRVKDCFEFEVAIWPE